MIYEKKYLHTIEANDNLIKIARENNTTIQKILADNPHINPFLLPVGKSIVVATNEKSAQNIMMAEFNLSNKMRSAWEQHVWWTREVVGGIIGRAENLNNSITRLLKNPEDIAGIFNVYYGDRIANQAKKLLTEHLIAAADIVTAMRDNNQMKLEESKKRAFSNADEIAAALGTINPFYSSEEIKKMLYDHLNMTVKEAQMKLDKNWAGDIATFDNIETEILQLADYLTKGIVKQFPEGF